MAFLLSKSSNRVDRLASNSGGSQCKLVLQGPRHNDKFGPDHVCGFGHGDSQEPPGHWTPQRLVCAQSAISTSTNINFLDFKLPSLIFLLFTPQALARAHDAKALSILRNHGFSPLLVVLFHLLLYVGRACWSSASTFATKLKEQQLRH
ncbi:unnamed protein product [Fusarium graminearum]|uniref:Uncharacterized protein n=1 Tax=Gibberella zeae TaxID=5518 RepID=A0A9N8REF0_GIBZA|nr:unnamed protein product [Fusarium graminearum]CAG1986721.1 unnamed protein product [Fusarium graminearum]CAG2016178.1 unnamed protein product [Fusarium graminearum]